jgi:hypothetical protein
MKSLSHTFAPSMMFDGCRGFRGYGSRRALMESGDTATSSSVPVEASYCG